MTEQDAFSDLARRWGPRIDALALRLLGDPEEARDVRQTVLMRLWAKTAAPFRGDAGFGTWLHRIVLNACRDRLRARRARQPTRTEADDHGPGAAPPADETAERHELAERVAAAVQALPDDERDVVMLRQYAGLTFTQVAEVLEIPATTAKSRMWRALERLRHLLSELAP